MASQVLYNNAVIPFIRGGDPYSYDNAVFAQDAARSAELAEFTIVAQNATTRKWVPLTSVDPTLTSGKLVCGAAGTAEAGFQAVSDAEFALPVDGVTVTLTGLDFTGIEAPTRTGAKLVCGAVGTNLAGFQAVTDGAFNFTVDGNLIAVTGIDLSTIADLHELIDPINAALAGRATAVWDDKTEVVTFLSNLRGDTSTITVLSAPAAGTDISGAGFLNGASGTGTATQGTGDDGTDRNIASVINDAAAGRFYCTYDGARFAFYSYSQGVHSSVGPLTAVSGGSGTDISGAGYLNGLTGTGTATAGTGGDGTNVPAGIIINSIPAASLVAGDVSSNQVIVGGHVIVDRGQVVLENSLALTDVVVGTNKTVQRVLEEIGIFMKYTTDISAYQA